MTFFAKKLKELFGTRQKNEDFFENLVDRLIEGDLGPKSAYGMAQALEEICTREKIYDPEKMLDTFRDLLFSQIKTVTFEPVSGKVNLYLVLGVNGVGKTTSVAKLAAFYDRKKKIPVIMAAGDTFRAAAIDQLKIHGERLQIRVVAHQNGSDPGAVVFDAADAAASKGGGLVLADTAGRLHNKENLVKELQKIDRIAQSKATAGCYKKLLVLDATTGQNALRQAEVFHESVGIDGVILTKYDSSAKGGVAVSVGKELGLPVAFVGTGEKYEDFAPFSPEKYIGEFLGIL